MLYNTCIASTYNNTEMLIYAERVIKTPLGLLKQYNLVFDDGCYYIHDINEDQFDDVGSEFIEEYCTDYSLSNTEEQMINAFHNWCDDK